MNIDWSNDEQVVKGRWPEAWRHRESGAVWGYAAEYVDPDALDYLGMDWEGARQHPTVQAWEAANRTEAALPEQEGDGDGRVTVACAGTGQCSSADSFHFGPSGMEGSQVSPVAPAPEGGEWLLARSFQQEASELLAKADDGNGDHYAEVHSRIAELLKAEASIPLIQQNANDNYAKSEVRLHEQEAESWRLREELAKDDERMFHSAMDEAMSPPSPEAEREAAKAIVKRIVEDVVEWSFARHFESVVMDLHEDATEDFPTQQEVLQDMLNLAMGDDIGCLEPDECNAENVPLLYVQEQLARAALSQSPQPSGGEK